LLKALTIVGAVLVVLVASCAVIGKGKGKSKGELSVKNINEEFDDMQDLLHEEVLSKQALKKYYKQRKKEEKAQLKHAKNHPTEQRCLYVLYFNGDVKASDVESLREEINAILMAATSKDEVLLVLESYGGAVPHYGLAASQLQRLRDNNIPLTVAIDKVAASGGYLMASVANTVLAAPFAIVGSIGVVAQLPNFHRLLKKNHIDFEQLTAGNYKRTLNVFAENTKEGIKKTQEVVEATHKLFKDYVKQYRPQVDIEKVATGEYWHASEAQAMGLVDRLITSDDYLLCARKTTDIYEVQYKHKKRLAEKLADAIHTSIMSIWTSIQQQDEKNRFV